VEALRAQLLDGPQEGVGVLAALGAPGQHRDGFALVHGGQRQLLQADLVEQVLVHGPSEMSERQIVRTLTIASLRPLVKPWPVTNA
jgi:hypothetical protein